MVWYGIWYCLVVGYSVVVRYWLYVVGSRRPNIDINVCISYIFNGLKNSMHAVRTAGVCACGIGASRWSGGSNGCVCCGEWANSYVVFLTLSLVKLLSPAIDVSILWISGDCHSLAPTNTSEYSHCYWTWVWPDSALPNLVFFAKFYPSSWVPWYSSGGSRHVLLRIQYKTRVLFSFAAHECLQHVHWRWCKNLSSMQALRGLI